MATAAKTKEPTIEDLSAQIETLKQDIGALTRLMGDLGTAKVSHAADTARATAEHFRDEGQRYARAASDSAQAQADAALDTVRRHPVNAIALAVGLGFLMGLLTGRR